MTGDQKQQLRGAKDALSVRAAMLAAAKVLGFAMTVPLPLMLVRVMTQTDFGLYKQVFQILQDSLSLLGLHVAASAYYFMPRYPEKRGQVALNVLIFYGTVGAALALVFCAYPRWVTWVFEGEGLVPYVPLLGIAIMFWLLSSLLEVVTVANSEVRVAAVFTIVVQFSKSALLLAAGLLFHSVHAIVLAALIQGALQCVLLFFYLRSRFGNFWQSFDRSLFKTQLSNAIPFGLGALAYVTQANLHNYFVSHYFDPSGFAIYSIGCFELPLLGLMLDAVISVLLPEAARREGQGDYQSILTLWASAVRKLAFFFVPAYALAFILRREIIVLLFTRSYEAAVPIFAVNLLAILLFISVPTSIIRAFDELKFFRLKLSCVMVPVMFGSLYFGIRFGGLLGAISAYMLVQNLDLAIIMARILKRLKATARDLRRLAPVVRIAAATAVSAGATALVHQVVNNLHPALVIIINGSVFAAIHLTISFLLGSITEDEKDQLKRLIARFQKPGSLLARPAPNEAR
jgi:O-antigen/teichoic acid export membrane protein